jgi:hypothetical protein
MRLEAGVRLGLKLLNSKTREGNHMLPGTDEEREITNSFKLCRQVLKRAFHIQSNLPFMSQATFYKNKKPLELTSIAGEFVTNSSNKAFSHRFGSAAATKRLQTGHFIPSHMGRPGLTACYRRHSSRHALQKLLRPSQAH